MSKKVRVEIKLYTYHDMDLVALYKTGQIVFPETTRQVLNSYANKEVYRVIPLPPNEKKVLKYSNDAYKKFYHYYVLLDEKEDKAAIDLIEHIEPGFRNNFIKAILRQYLCGLFSSAYSTEQSAKFFNEMSRLIQSGREEKTIRTTRQNNSATKSSIEARKPRKEVEKNSFKGNKDLHRADLEGRRRLTPPADKTTSASDDNDNRDSEFDDMLMSMTEQY